MARMSMAVFSILVASAAVAADYPFVGVWNCEVGTFTFTSTTYNNGSETLRMTRVVRKGGNFELHFPRNYVITLSAIKARTMGWYSSASSDSFSCKRVK